MAHPRKPSLKSRDVTTAAAEVKKKTKKKTTAATAANTTTTTTVKRTTKKGAAGAAPAAGASRSRKKFVKVEEMEETAPLLVDVEGMEEEEVIVDDDEEWDEEEEKKEQKKKKQKKTKKGAQKACTQNSTPRLMLEIFTNPRLVQDLFINPKWITKGWDFVVLGSTCKALGAFREAPETITQDLKSHKLRYIHRFVGALVQRPMQNLKSLSLSRIHSMELCDEVKHCLAAGKLLALLIEHRAALVAPICDQAEFA